MQKRIAFLFIAALVLISCASPAPEPTVTVAPSSTYTAAPTSTLTPTATATLTPTPRSAGLKIATMAEFPHDKSFEKGTVVTVDDLYGVGEARLEVVDVKTAPEGTQFEYRKVRFINGEKGSYLKHPSSLLFVSNTTVESLSLIKVDIANNEQVADGAYTVMRLGSLVDGEPVSFELWVAGNMFMGVTAQDIFKTYVPGDVIRFDVGFPDDSDINPISLEDIIKHLQGLGEPPEFVRQAVFSMIGVGSNPQTTASIKKIILNGGVLSPAEAGAFSVDHQP